MAGPLHCPLGALDTLSHTPRGGAFFFWVPSLVQSRCFCGSQVLYCFLPPGEAPPHGWEEPWLWEIGSCSAGLLPDLPCFCSCGCAVWGSTQGLCKESTP